MLRPRVLLAVGLLARVRPPFVAAWMSMGETPVAVVLVLEVLVLEGMLVLEGILALERMMVLEGVLVPEVVSVQEVFFDASWVE